MNSQEMAAVPKVLRDFLQYLQIIKGKSPATIDEYYLDLRSFFRFIKRERGMVPSSAEWETIDIADISIELVKTVTLSDAYAYLYFCQTERGNKAAARARKVSCLHSYFKYLTGRTNQLSVNPVEQLDLPKIRRSLPKYLTLEQSLDLLNAVDGPYCERDYCMLTLFLNCGFRLSELCGLNLSDIRGDSTIRVIGKGDKERVVYLNDVCKEALEEYLKVRPVDGVKDKKALFLSRLKKRISPKTVQHIVYSNLNKAGLSGQGLSVHKLRHTAATLMYQYGSVDIRVLKEILGHESLSTTEIYTHLGSDSLEKAMRSNPLNTSSRTSSANKTASTSSKVDQKPPHPK